ncbi:MAG: metal-dependent hydrolase [Gammaproteobacteria bacterium]
MPTILSHPAVPLAIGIAAGSRIVPARLLFAGMIASVLPDLDVVAFRLGIGYSHEWGHRGASHSLVFALLLAVMALVVAPRLRIRPCVAFSFVFAAAISHGLLDMLTTGGLGVALLWPFTDARFFFPIQVIEVSPLSLRRFFGQPGVAALTSELIWIWAPAVVATASAYVIRYAMETRCGE